MRSKVDRAGRKEQIKTLLKSENRLLSSYELARRIGGSPSWFWRDLFLEMWKDGEIVACSVRLRNGKPAYFWGTLGIDCYTQTRLQGLE